MEKSIWNINFLILCDCKSKFLKSIDQERNINIIIDTKVTSQGPFCFLKSWIDGIRTLYVSHSSFAMNVK